MFFGGKLTADYSECPIGFSSECNAPNVRRRLGKLTLESLHCASFHITTLQRYQFRTSSALSTSHFNSRSQRLSAHRHIPLRHIASPSPQLRSALSSLKNSARRAASTWRFTSLALRLCVQTVHGFLWAIFGRYRVYCALLQSTLLNNESGVSPFRHLFSNSIHALAFCSLSSEASTTFSYFFCLVTSFKFLYVLTRYHFFSIMLSFCRNLDPTTVR